MRHTKTDAKSGSSNAAGVAGAAKKTKSLKNRIRDLKRLLSRPNCSLSEEVRQEKQRQIEEMEKQTPTRKKIEKQKFITQKYLGVRFVERRKLERKLAQAQKRLAKLPEDASTEVRQTLLDEIEKLKGDILYVKHFPTGKKYISLLTKQEICDPKALRKRESYRTQIISKYAEVSARMEENRGHHDSDEELEDAANGRFQRRGQLRQKTNVLSKKRSGRNEPAAEAEEDNFFMEDDDL